MTGNHVNVLIAARAFGCDQSREVMNARPGFLLTGEQKPGYFLTSIVHFGSYLRSRQRSLACCLSDLAYLNVAKVPQMLSKLLVALGSLALVAMAAEVPLVCTVFVTCCLGYTRY